jgi:hypothetical protein
MRVPLNTYRHMAFESFRRNCDLSRKAEDRIARSGVLLCKEKLESHIDKLRNKIVRASNGHNGSNGSNGRVSHARPTSREVQQVHQEIRAVLAALKNGDGAL